MAPEPTSNGRPTTLRDARREAGLKQREVAAEAGCAVSLVCMTEKGYLPGLEKREAMARAVGASAGSFWGEA